MNSKQQETLQRTIQSYLTKVRDFNDFDTLKEIRKTFRKNVPITMRSWILSMLLYEAAPKASLSSGGNRKRQPSGRPAKETRPSRTTTAPTSKPKKDRADFHAQSSSTGDGRDVFISLGRARGYNKEKLTALLVEEGNLKKEDILKVQQRESYSFVKVPTSEADKLIERLNGTMVGKLRLRVNYAKGSSN